MHDCPSRRDVTERPRDRGRDGVNDNDPIDWDVIDYGGGMLHQPWDPQDLTWLGDPFPLPKANPIYEVARLLIARTRDW